jgi:two-component system KDP operon response regulator KdpE
VSAFHPRILVIDDDPQIHRFLGSALIDAGFEAARADTAVMGLEVVAAHAPDAVILDLDLPDMDGKTALEQIRARYAGPILILSARNREIEKIEALDLGADNYIEKPFSMGELLARVRVALRHQMLRSGRAPRVRAGEVVVDLILRQVTLRGEPVDLSPMEAELLATLASGGGGVLTHENLAAALWGRMDPARGRHLRVLINQLRQKLEVDPSAPRIILNEPRIGYRFRADRARS